MQILPNGLRVFNATPHAITFWCEDWTEVVSVATDEIINARPVETPYGCLQPDDAPDWENVWLVKTEFVGDDAGREVIARAREAGAEIIVGSIIAAQAYPGDVVAMVPAPGFERVPPAEKRMLPGKFTVFQPQLPDGIYAIQSGRPTRIDSFAWGDEGVLPASMDYVHNSARHGTILDGGPGWY